MFYEENRHLEEEDMGYDSPVYHINLYDKSFLIAVGKERRLIQKKNTYYFPIYLLNKTDVQTQIGAFQFESSKETQQERVKPFLDSSGDLDLNRLGDPIFYSFANYDYFQDITVDITPMGIKELESQFISKKAESVSESFKGKEEEEEEQEEVEEANPFELSSSEIKPPEELGKASKVLKDGIFTIDKTGKRVQMLPEESKETAYKIREEYVSSTKSAWIEKFMKNTNFDIVETATNGNCLFDTVRLAYQQIGYETTIDKLRALVAKEVTKEKYDEYRELYLSTLAEIEATTKELKRMAAENKNLKERLASIPTTDKSARSTIIKQANEIKKQHSHLKERQQLNHEFLGEFQHMATIDTLDKFRAYIQTPSYWADDWALNVLEKELNMKFIIFSSEAFDENDLANVLKCSLTDIPYDAVFKPDFYIMTTYSGDHYRLISYSTKRIFTFREIPYDVKMIIVIRCMESNSGLFSQIPEFSDFKTKLGIQETEEEDESVSGGGVGDRKIDYDPKVIFSFYDKSNKKQKPGKAAGEHIPSEKIYEFADLAIIPDWRKKLDDEYVSAFTLDNKQWKTVEHYYQAAKFKKHNPHFYNMFSLDDTSSDIAKDVKLARAAGSQSGSFKKGKKQIPLRPSTVKIDPDFYGERKNEERERALYAKFSQNEELKSLIILTRSATLKHYIPKQKAEKDFLLMKVRSKIQREN
jgi:predicted NAD-dependent protein-ADP-ribosyltransferase YbiA (DUF1768 family)